MLLPANFTWQKPYGKINRAALTKAFEKHNVALHLNHPVTVTKFFGIQKQASVVLVFVDSPDKFIAAVILPKTANG